MQGKRRTIRIDGGRTLSVTPVFDTYWRFAAARQEVFAKRVAGTNASRTGPTHLDAQPTLLQLKVVGDARSAGSLPDGIVWSAP